MITPPLPDRPSRFIASTDGTRVAVFSAGAGAPLLLVHGTSGDHRTWRAVAPALAERWRIHAIDRRGRGDSGDGPVWSIEREIEDLATVAEALAAEAGQRVDVVGHSLGGRLALAASHATPSIRRVVAYESAPGRPEVDPSLIVRLRALLDAGDLDELLATFMTEAVGMPEPELPAFRANPIWPLRAAAGPTIVRELEAAQSAPAIGLESLGQVGVPVLQLIGSASAPWFLEAADALDARLALGSVEVITGARHAAHHSHPAEFVSRVEAFLGR